jgi:hypothetical protein
VATVRIYQPAKTAMQSGRAKTHEWVLEYEPAAAQQVEPLMGWTGAGDTVNQVRMTFATKEEAIAFAEKSGLAYEVVPPRVRRVRPKSYTDNFRHDREKNWTH